MNKRTKMQFISGASLFVLFVLYTISLKLVDVRPIGPNGSYVAYAGINKAIHAIFKVNFMLYNITDWAGVVAIFVAFGFAVLGLAQWIKRKSILKVDTSLLLLGVFYIVVFGTYLFFEYVAINHRPVLISGVLEASYPSSTTMLAMCVLPTAMMQFDRLISNFIIKNAVNILCSIFTAFMVIGRLFSGVHWFTDIVGALLFSVSVILIYRGAVNCTESKT